MVPRKSMRVKRTSKKRINHDDRFTTLPDDLIHHIYSRLDSRSVVQSSVLSRKWREKWKFHPHLKFEINPSTGRKFSNFVHRFLSDRKNADLSTIDFRSNSIPLYRLKEIIAYANSHTTHKLNIEYLNRIQTRRGRLDSSLFKSNFLKDIRLNIDFELLKYPNLTWDLPALTTLHLEKVTFAVDPPNNDGSTCNKSLELFSALPNLKTLILVNCRLWDVHTFYITSSRLETLSIDCLHRSCRFVISAPKLISFTYDNMLPALLFTNDLVSLETVNFQAICDSSVEEQKYVDLMINAFHQLHNAKFLTLSAGALMLLSKFPKIHEGGGCPFVRLQTLTLNGRLCLSVPYIDILSYFRGGLPDHKVHIESKTVESSSSRNMNCSCGVQFIVRFCEGFDVTSGS